MDSVLWGFPQEFFVKSKILSLWLRDGYDYTHAFPVDLSEIDDTIGLGGGPVFNRQGQVAGMVMTRSGSNFFTSITPNIIIRFLTGWIGNPCSNPYNVKECVEKERASSPIKQEWFRTPDLLNL